MKSLLVYYSHYGNTAYVAAEFAQALRKFGPTDMEELRYRRAYRGVLVRFFYRLFPVLADLEPLSHDLNDYDLLCLGIPVWGGRPSAPISKYLTLAKNIQGKKVICFFIFNFQESAKACFAYIKRILEKKGNFSPIVDVYIPWQKVIDKKFLDRIIHDATVAANLT